MPQTASTPQRGDGLTAQQLDLAVRDGIITAAQRDRLLGLAAGPVPGDAGEARSGLNLVTVGYWAGSVAVLFALAWFLVDRWKSLRPAGVLAVAVLYALSFAFSSALLNRLGYRVAAALLTLLTVGMAPIMAWCVESIVGVWPSPTIRRDMFAADVIESIRWIPVQLSMALAGLVALRKVGFGLLTLTVTIPMGMAIVHLTPWIFDPELNFHLSGWMILLAGTLMFVTAYVLELRVPGHAEDYAGWVYLSALGFLIAGLMQVTGQTRLISHLLPVVVALLVGLGLALRRRLFLLPALMFFIAYLAFLANDVFPTAVGFMIVMLTVGALLILGTVVAQRRFPQLIRRLSGEGTPRQAPRAVGMVFAALVALAVVLLFTAVPRARAQAAELQRRRNEQFRAQVERQRAAATRARMRQDGETKGEGRP